MCFLKQTKSVMLLLLVASCATTSSPPKKGTYSYLATKGIAAPNMSSSGVDLVTKSSDSGPDQSKWIFESLCSSPAIGKKISVKVALVMPNMPSGISLQKAQALRQKVRRAASDSLSGFFKNDFYQTARNYENRKPLEARLAHLRETGFKELIEDFKYNAPIFQTPVYFYLPKQDTFVLTFSSSLYDESFDEFYSPILATNSDKSASYLFFPSGDSLKVEAKRAYLWSRPTGVTLKSEDGWPKASYKFENFDGYYSPANWVDSKKFVTEPQELKLNSYNPADLTEMRLLMENYVVVPDGMTDTTKLLTQKDRIWSEYIKRFTEVSSSETGDPSVSNNIVTLDLSQMCSRARHVTDLLSK